MESEYQEQAKVFKALCDPKRLAILEQLRGGEKCACVLQEPLNLTQSGLSYHMKILCDSGIVVSRQEGKWTHYRLSAPGREKAVELLRKLTTPDSEQEKNCSKCG
ncbi:MAG TPA: metalloregulator ArsR/SmtB family transcription factor [Candidatus Blautia intestinipullorum]|nr:metalloregulator ArsR/SmtB family transcription factor [Candidatus Blautia intestinipullorum]